MRGAAFFDLDGTLLPWPSAEWRWWWQRRGRPNFTDPLPAPAAQLVARLAARLAAKMPSAAALACARHRRCGEPLVLLTGAPQPLAEALARCWKFDAVLGKRTAEGVWPRGPEKLRLARHWCALHGYALAASTAYANAWADRWLLAAVAHPVAIAPQWRLARLSRRRGWTLGWTCGRALDRTIDSPLDRPLDRPPDSPLGRPRHPTSHWLHAANSSVARGLRQEMTEGQ